MNLSKKPILWFKTTLDPLLWNARTAYPVKLCIHYFFCELFHSSLLEFMYLLLIIILWCFAYIFSILNFPLISLKYAQELQNFLQSINCSRAVCVFHYFPLSSHLQGFYVKNYEKVFLTRQLNGMWMYMRLWRASHCTS